MRVKPRKRKKVGRKPASLKQPRSKAADRYRKMAEEGKLFVTTIEVSYPKLALLSVFDKTGIAEFARELHNMGWVIISSGGTAKAISDGGVPVVDVADYTGLKPILKHRVATLTPKIHAGLLATEDMMPEMLALKYWWIDLVCVDMYPLSAEIASPTATRESVIEKTDIGGPTMLRSGAKGRRIVVATNEDRTWVIEALQKGDVDSADRDRLAAKAEGIVADYCLDSARYTSGGSIDGQIGTKVYDLAYGENRYQSPAAFHSTGAHDTLAFENFRLVEGSAPGFVNATDLDRMIQTMTHIAAGFDVNFDFVPKIAIAVKHGNCCGAAVGFDSVRTLESMLDGDQLAVHGAFIMANFPIGHIESLTLRTWEQLPGKRRIIDGVVAPGIDETAREILGRTEGKCRMFVNPVLEHLNRDNLDKAVRYRYVRGGFLTQPNYSFILDLSKMDYRAPGADGVFHVINKQGRLTEFEEMDMILAWAVGSTSNSNTITLASGGAIIGNAVGQQDRVLAAELAVIRAKRGKHGIGGSIAYSDSFFPFPDGIDVLADAGVAAVFTSEGSINDSKVFASAKEKGLVVYSINDGVCRGFYGH